MEHNFINNNLGTNSPDDLERIYNTWNNSGLLVNIENKDHSLELALLLEEAARMIVNGPDSVYSQWTQTLILPAIRRIYSACRGMNNQEPNHYHLRNINQENLSLYTKRKALQDEMVAMIDIQILFHRLDNFVIGFMTPAEIYLKHIDFEKELLGLFTTNEQMEMFNTILMKRKE